LTLIAGTSGETDLPAIQELLERNSRKTQTQLSTKSIQQIKVILMICNKRLFIYLKDYAIQ
jgi:hypothetical protein